MADDDRGPSSSPHPLGGAALRQAQRRDHSLFSGPPPQLDDSGGLWTQFSGMPQQPGSPTSLHQWLQSADETSLPGNSATARTYPATASSSPGGSRNSPLDKFAADFLTMGIGPDRARNAPMHSNMGHHFDYGPRRDMGSPTDFGTPPDFPASHSSGFSQSPAGPFSSSPSEMSGLPPDFSQPPPDFSFTAQPDFSRPPPSFAAHDVPLLPHGADPHQGLTDFLATCSQQSYPHQEAGRCGDRRIPTSSPVFDTSSLNSQPLPRLHDIMPGHIDVSLPPPNFMPFLAASDDVFQGAVDFDEHKQNKIHNMERAAPAQKRVVRQNSEPAHEEGKAMYVEALRRLNSFGPSGPSYEPFGSTTSQSDDTAETASTLSDDAYPPTSKHAKRKEPSRPSYSDVAKTAKGKPSHPKGEASTNEKEFEGFPKAAASDQPSAYKHNRHHPPTKRAFTNTRIVNHRAKASQSETGGQGNYVQPNSRYGLDHFDDMAEYVRAEHRSSSVEALNSHHNPDMIRRSSVECLSSQQHPSTARRSNNSSPSNATSAEDNNFVKPPTLSGGGGTGADGGRGGVRCRDKSSNLSSKDAASQDSSVYNNSSNISSPVSSSGTVHQQLSQQNKCSTNPPAPASQKLKNDKVFFDPKRIFQSRGSSRSQDIQMEKTKLSEDRGRGDGEGAKKEETILNNGKPNNTTTKASAASHRKADYINNDLREGAAASTSAGSSGSGGSGGSGKRTNQTAALNRHGSRKHSGKDSMSQNGSGAERSRGGDSRGRRQENDHEDDNSFIRNIDWVLVDEWMKYISDFTMTFARNSFSAILTLLFYLLGFIMYLAMGAIHLIGLVIGKLWTMVQSRFFKDQGRSFTSGADATRRRFGVEENITLPSTGEEAMKRLLACKGKDPYGILGLRSDATDEDIKRYYRRQAVLVHPDKNQEPGAEEAFKILGHAFEMIGEPAKRKEYDAHIFETSEAEAAMREFSDLLTKLQEKVQEAANMMRCDHCGGKHRRVPVNRAWYSARFCDKCNIHHSAKEGDVWAESSMLGFLWHYYACMDNNIYDITDWVSCQRDNFKHMKANAHPVFYRIQTDSSRRHRQGQSGDADLEDFINRLFNKASMSPDGTAPPGWQFPSQQAGGTTSQSGWGNSTSSTTSSTNSKRSRRKKKRN